MKIFILTLMLFIITGCSSKTTATPVVTNTNTQKLEIKNNYMIPFENSLKNKILYESSSNVMAGVIPHHLTAANMISGFFDLASKNQFDTIIILAPNHNGDLGDVIISNSDWDFSDGVYNDNELYNILKKIIFNNIRVTTNNNRIEEDHSASVHIPYVNNYFPNAKVFPILISRSLSLENTLVFSKALNDCIDNLNKKVLVISSIDFSHFLTKENALKNDVITLETIKNRDYQKLFGFSNEYIDSPNTMIIFLEYLKKHDLTLEVFDHKDGTDFSNVPAKDTTSYFIFGGVK